MNNYELFLGGYDAEMLAIKDLAIKNNISVHDANLGWGAKASAYLDQIKEVIEKDKTPVLIELELDIPEDLLSKVKVIDHHGDLSGREASILQVVNLFGLIRTRFIELIGANDSGYIPAMEEIGGTKQEISEIRKKDREAQGITDEQEQQAEKAIQDLERFFELEDLIIIKLPHSKTATVTDRLYGTQQKQNMLILSGDGEVNYYGNGILCKKLGDKFEGWSGGSGLGKEDGVGFWGGYSDQVEVEKFIKEFFSNKK